MPIKFQCPTCGTEYNVKEELAGRRVRCKSCQEPMTVPRPELDDFDLGAFFVEEVYDSPIEAAPRRPRPTSQLESGREKRVSSVERAGALSQAALWSLILGCLSPVCCGLISGIPAAITGIVALVNISNSNGTLRGKGMAISGISLGILGPIAVGLIILSMGGIPALIGPQLRYSDMSRNNLKQLGLALHNYHDVHRTFPPGGVHDSQDTGHHGWQTMLLPFMEHQHVYNSIDFNVPWTDPVNAAPMQTSIPQYIVSPLEEQHDAAGYALSHWTGNSHLFGKNTKTGIRDIIDGTSNTIMAGDAAGNYKPWGHPENYRDPAVGIDKGPDSFGSAKGGLFVLADGSVVFLSADISPDVLRALATHRGGEVVDGTQLGE